MKAFTLFGLLIFSFTILNAQVKFEKRIEFELYDGYSQEHIVEFNDKGFILFAFDENYKGKTNKWHYQLYNTDLEKEKAIDINIPKKYYIDSKWHNDELLVTLFKNKKGKYVLSSINPSTMTEKRVSGSFPKKAYARDMIVFGDYAYFNMSIKKDEFLYSINRITGKQTIIPIIISGYNSKYINVIDFQYLEKTKEVFLYISSNVKKERELYIMTLDSNGNKTDLFKLTSKVDKNLIGISANSLGNNKYLYVGTYSEKNTGVSEGIFVCKAERDKIDFIKYYRYDELNNFFKYLPKRTQNKIDRKKKRKKENGKHLKYKYRLALHEMKQVEDGYIFLGEAFFPTYYTYSTTTYSNGMSNTTTYTVFDGYQYTHAVLVKFDNNGNLEWDQIFKMNPWRKPFYVKRFISIDEENKDEGLFFVFADGNRIVSKAFNLNGGIIYDKTSDDIESMYEGDKTKWSVSDLVYWYKGYFISYGRQKIKNTEESAKNKKGKKVKKKRKVYFITKIAY